LLLRHRARQRRERHLAATLLLRDERLVSLQNLDRLRGELAPPPLLALEQRRVLRLQSDDGVRGALLPRVLLRSRPEGRSGWSSKASEAELKGVEGGY
jgi:hypothetical protein